MADVPGAAQEGDPPSRARLPSVTGLMRKMASVSVSMATDTVRDVASLAATAVPVMVPPIRAAASAVQDGGRKIEAVAHGAADEAMRRTIRTVVDAALQVLDLTAIVREHVDLNAIVADVDLDAAVARVDLDRIVARVDIEQIIAGLDLDAVAERIDLMRQLDRVDLNEVAKRIDINALAGSIDLNSLARRIDLDPLVATVDIDAVIARVDLVGLASVVIDAIDLPAIIRDSTGALSSETVRGFRTHTRNADDLVSGFVGRLLGQGSAESPHTRG
ncbi:hypothetical protein [Nakamurella lactea]|uniref:hypothetical protein n=1 Tax=Nakamurella lactea TaxID=459515 RepID=UPI0004225E52|nr:hypothetical protein [Nakamurella lactea]